MYQISYYLLLQKLNAKIVLVETTTVHNIHSHSIGRWLGLPILLLVQNIYDGVKGIKGNINFIIDCYKKVNKNAAGEDNDSETTKQIHNAS